MGDADRKMPRTCKQDQNDQLSAGQDFYTSVHKRKLGRPDASPEAVRRWGKIFKDTIAESSTEMKGVYLLWEPSHLGEV